MSLAACLQSRGLSQHLQRGLQALGKHAACLEMRHRKAQASVDLDAALQKSAPNAPRWDYGVDAADRSRPTCVWIEVHPATSSEVKTVVEKLRWLQGWLRQSDACRAATHEFYWVATEAGVRIDTKRQRELAAAGLKMPKRRVVL
jgi:hypothetical protein